MRDARSDGVRSECIDHGVPAFNDEDHPDATLAFSRMRAEEGVVPALWWFEVRNILMVNERRRRGAMARSPGPQGRTGKTVSLCV
jgi:hypothetical protein